MPLLLKGKQYFPPNLWKLTSKWPHKSEDENTKRNLILPFSIWERNLVCSPLGRIFDVTGCSGKYWKL
jgi:hypothetical protein